jgi:hypothetical protein
MKTLSKIHEFSTRNFTSNHEILLFPFKTSSTSHYITLFSHRLISLELPFAPLLMKFSNSYRKFLPHSTKTTPLSCVFAHKIPPIIADIITGK